MRLWILTRFAYSSELLRTEQRTGLEVSWNIVNVFSYTTPPMRLWILTRFAGLSVGRIT